MVVVILEGLENILRVGSRGGGVNPYAVLIEEAYGKFACSSFVVHVYLHILRWPGTVTLFMRFVSSASVK